MRSSTFSSQVEAAWSSVSRRCDLVVEDERALLEHVDRLLPAAFAGEQRLEGRERAEVRRVDRDDAAPCIDGFVDAAEHVAFELTELCVQLDRLVLVDRARQLTDVDDPADASGDSSSHACVER